MLCSLSDDVYKRSRLLRVRACLQLHLWAGWDGSTEVQKQAHWQEHYKTFYATNPCGKETKADEVLSLFEVRLTQVYLHILTLTMKIIKLSPSIYAARSIALGCCVGNSFCCFVLCDHVSALRFLASASVKVLSSRSPMPVETNPCRKFSFSCAVGKVLWERCCGKGAVRVIDHQRC